VAAPIEAVRMPDRVAGTDELVLEIPPDPEQIRTARLFAAASARHFGIDEERVEDLKVAISEACTNAMKAHRHSGLGDPIRVIATPDPGGVRFAVVDAGAGFDPPEALVEAEDDAPPSGITEGTLGLALIGALFPGAEIERNAGRGMTVLIFVEHSNAEAPDLS